MLELAARQISNKEKNLIILKEYSAAGEYINAARTKFTAEFLHKVIEKAGNILTPLEKSPFGEEVISYLTKTYSLNHGDIEYIAGEGLAAFYPLSFIFDGKPRFHLLDTDFVSVIGDNTFHWNTTIGIVGDYSQSGLTTVLETFKDIKKKVRVLIVQLEWEMKVTNDLKCDEFKILSYKLVHSYWKPAEEFYSKEPIQESKGSEQL